MSGVSIGRRGFGKGMLALGGAAVLGLPAPAIVRAAGGPLRIGLLLPRSGYLAQAGQACQRAAEIAPALLAEMGMPVEILSADTESNPDIARQRTEKLIDDGAQTIIGAFGSGETAAAAQVCEQRGVPLVINIAAAPQITEQGHRTVFRNFPTSPTLIRNGLALMKELFRASGTTPKSAVFLHANDTFGQANKAALDALFPSLGMPFALVDQISYDPKAQDLAVEVAKAKATGAELVIVTTRANDAIMLVREMVRQRWSPMGLVSPGSPGFYDEQFYKVLGKYSDHCLTNLPWIDPKSPLSRQLEAAFVRKFPGERYQGYAFNVGFTFEAMLVAADAARRAGDTASEPLLAALRTTRLQERIMIGGPISFDAKGQNPDIASACIQNRDLHPVVVLPESAAEQAPVFPMPAWSQRG
jgi:branched-chain amino acid transport system substrate-binding protein